MHRILVFEWNTHAMTNGTFNIENVETARKMSSRD